MANELERRITAIEKRVLTATPCTHPLVVLTNPSAEELAAAESVVASCPRCSRPSFGMGPALIVIEFPRG